MLINPEVELLGDERVLCWEGCLSIPGLRAAVPRAPRIRYRGVDCDGVVTEREVTGFHADVIQHEYDHLDGVLFIHKLGMTAKLMLRRPLQELEEQYELKRRKRVKT